MVLPPYFLKPGADGLMFYYEAISKAVRIPIMVQDAPLMSQVPMPAALLARMAREIEHVSLVKVEAPPTSAKFTQILESQPPVTLFGGLNGNFFIEEYDRGSRGVMPGSDMIPEFVRLWNLLETGKREEAWRLFVHLLPLIRFELQPGLGVCAMKHNLMAKGVIASAKVRHPTSELDAAGLKELASLREWIASLGWNQVRWYIAGLLFLSSVINYVDRQVLSVVAPVLTKELHISPVGYANILQAFLIPYTLMYVGSGFLVDRWGARKSLAIFMAWWSTANMLHGFARGALSLAFFRGLLGIGEPGNFMAGFRAISEWYPPKEKAFVNGLLNGGAAVGAIVAPPLVAWLSIVYGWRMAFVVTGALGFFWLAAWLWLVPQPEAVVYTTAKEPWLKLLAKRETWSLLLPRFVSDPVWWFYLLWLPKYLADQRGFTMREIGMLAWMPYLAADLGALAGGLWSGWLVKRGVPVLKARSMAMWPFTLLMPMSLLIPGASTTVALAIICLVAFAHMAWKTNLQTVTNDVFPLRVVGSVSGIIAFGSGLGGSLFTSLTGWVVQNISYDAIFYVMGFLHPISYLIFRFLLRERFRLEPQLEVGK